MALYHADIKLPKNFVPPRDRVVLGWTKHAMRARVDDRYGEIPEYATLPLNAFEVIEVETRPTPYGEECVKYVLRGHRDRERDVIFVLIPGTVVWTVKTVWQNLRTDTHKTLDRSRYVC